MKSEGCDPPEIGPPADRRVVHMKQLRCAQFARKFPCGICGYIHSDPVSE